MSTTMTRGDVQATRALREYRDVLCEAIDAGWTVHQQGRSMHAVSPDGGRSFQVINRGTGVPNMKAIRQWRRWIGDTVLSAQVAEAVAADALLAGVAVGDTAEATAAVRTALAAYDANADGDEIAEQVLRGATVKHRERAMAVVTPHVVHEAPWLAKKQPGRDGGALYESETTIERRWSDGATDYRCAFDGCDYTSDRPRSVSRHYAAKHVRSRETEPVNRRPPIAVVDPEYTEPTTHRDGYRPTDRLVDALAAFLQQQIDQWGDLGPESLADAALRWFHDRPDLPDAEVREPRVLTSDEIVDRIRLLVGTGRDPVLEARVAALEADLSSRDEYIDGLEAQVLDMHERLGIAETALGKARENLAAFREIAAEIEV